VSDELIREQHGNVLFARLNRPDVRNALNGALIEQIGLAMLEADEDPAVRAVVLTGTGDRAFCAGMDLQDFASGNQRETDERAMEGYRRLSNGELTVPVIGAANATAVAGGFELLLACDVIVASSAAKFGLPEVKRGLFAAGGGILLGTRIPLAIALELTLTGDTIDAKRAYALGLVNNIVPPDEVVPAALAFAARIAANGPLAVAATKELVRLSVRDFERARQRRDELVKSVFGSDDAKEGARAFVEKRAPVWQGR
jgi:enoyl-CoA hydratase/carnithine racemase